MGGQKTRKVHEVQFTQARIDLALDLGDADQQQRHLGRILQLEHQVQAMADLSVILVTGVAPKNPCCQRIQVHGTLQS